ncbi:MAG: hypothetical protein FWD57_10225, partial [Polyangiaceae bacterium]|nr:hypothetical protein [Polyangiaceae bacterium]
KDVPCIDVAPTNATSDIVDVPITYTTDDEWTTAKECDWSCNTNYTTEDNATCINSKLVPCFDNPPTHATSIVQDVSIGYTTALEWADPAECLWVCDAGYEKDADLGNTCILSVDCTPNTCNGHGDCELDGEPLPAPVCTCEPGYAAPNCGFCDTDYTFDGGTVCIQTKKIQCNPDNVPEHSTATLVSVEVSYTTEDGWTDPADCEWVCDPGYEKDADDGETCILSTDCTANTCNGKGTCSLSDDEPPVPVCDCNDGYAPPNCATCDTDYTFADDGKTCINTKQVPCSSANTPENANPSVTNVGITYTTEGGWTEPTDCDWVCKQGWEKDAGAGDSCVPSEKCTDNTCNGRGECRMVGDAPPAPVCTCDDGYASPNCATCAPNYTFADDGKTCINSKQAMCSTQNANPRQQARVVDVTITYSDDTGWSNPPDCEVAGEFLVEGAGCGCTVPGSADRTSSTGTSAVLLGILGLGLGLVRRTRVRSDHNC